jgi:hypothetical protein
MTAAYNGYTDIVRILVQHGADVDMQKKARLSHWPRVR